MTLVEERDIEPVIMSQTIDSVVEKTKQSTSHTLSHEIKVVTAKKSKTPTFSRVFHSNFFDNFSREIKVVNS